MNKDKLKKTLSTIVDTDYEVSTDVDYKELTNIMLEKIGDTDPVLRDELIYMIMANWIDKDIYSNKELKEILNICLDEDHLFYNIDSKEDDSVFTRTFSALQIAMLIYKDNNLDYLTQKEFNETAKLVCSYYKKEKDLRGYIENKGWAHSAAHGADIFAEIANNKKVQTKTLKNVLDVVNSKIKVDNYIYFNNEDERISKAVTAVIKANKLDDQYLSNWFNSLLDIKEINNRNKKDTLISNIKNFLRSLYFNILEDEEIDDKYIVNVTNTLKELEQKRF
jgi:REP element-mobilizing transposase RayT